MASIGPRDNMSLSHLMAGSAMTPGGTAPPPPSPGPLQGRPANLSGAMAMPRCDLPSAVRENTVAAVHARSAQPPNTSGSQRTELAMERLQTASDKLKESRDNGVDLAKTSFFKKLLGVATAVVGVGVAAALTVVTGGIAAPLLAVSCLNLVINVGDSVCAYRNMRNVQDTAAGLPPRFAPLPGGNSCVQNLFHGIAKAAGASDENAALTGQIAAGFFHVGMAVATFVTGNLIGGAAMALAPQVSGIVTNGLKAVVAFDTVVTTGDAAKGRIEEARELMANANGLTEGAGIPELASSKVARILVGDVPADLARTTEAVNQAASQYGNAAVNGIQSLTSLCSIGRAVLSVA